MQNFVALRITVAMATLQNFNFFRVFERHNLREATRASRVFNAAPRKWYRWIEQEISFQEDFQHFSISLQILPLYWTSAESRAQQAAEA